MKFKLQLKAYAIIVVFFVCHNLSAQMTISYALDRPAFIIGHVDTDKYQTLDSCYLTVTYRTQFRMAEKADSLEGNELLDLQMGRKYNAFFSRDLREVDIKNTEALKNNPQDFLTAYGFITFDMIFNHIDNKVAVTNRLPYTSQVVEYSEKIPKLDWKYIPEETDTVMGHLCKAAVCNYGGRDWKVFYTDEIALPYGPWLLNGTKGLVLKAQDADGDYIFTAEGLSQKPQPIVRYEWDRKKMEKDKWRDYERGIYKHAGDFVRSTGAHLIIIDNSEQGYHRFKDENWEEYYNPLEK